MTPERWLPSREAAYVQIDGRAAVLDLGDPSALPVILEGTGAELWRDLAGGVSLDDLVEAQVRRHPGVERTTIVAGVEAFVADLARRRLLEVAT
ncbi:PqqD family peptide modification chaperone [Nocardioides sp. MAH-18]|uniref:PqqD family peptide modification chaperone n=1 Tax=Nocardioides agri TaxID=2682843 RepID=A0A6L6XR17_9ACTN|nr:MULTISPECIES: PqqD family protein [unclassified Nocardioides]MBA2954559.1 PqqD family protein [Nocardioides sp. CGMCC 1.13656]MVQ49418.1 PqqD family peptide modification chaperone [Nocardioides sp. MAH-18]